MWLTDGSCVRRRPAYRHHVWAYAFLTARTQDGRVLKILIERWRREYNPVRPHSALGYRCLRRSLLIGQLHPYNRGGHEESHPPVHLSHEPDRWDGVRYLRV